MTPDIIIPIYTTADLTHHYIHPNRPFPRSTSPLFDLDDPYSSESESPPAASPGHLLALDEYEAELYPLGWPIDVEGAVTILEKITPVTTSISFFIDTIRSLGFRTLFAGLISQARLGLVEGRGEWKLREISTSFSFSRGSFDDDVWEALATLPRDLPFLRSLVLEGNELNIIHPSLLLSIRLHGENFRLLLDGNAFNPTTFIATLIQHAQQYPRRCHALSALELGDVSIPDALALLSMGRSGLEEIDLRIPTPEHGHRKVSASEVVEEELLALASGEVGPQPTPTTFAIAELSRRLLEILEHNFWLRRLGQSLFSARLDNKTLARIKIICRRNVLLRTRTRRAALVLLAHARPILLSLTTPLPSTPSSPQAQAQASHSSSLGEVHLSTSISSPSSSSSSSSAIFPLHRLPYELILACLASLDYGALSSRQHESVCRWAEDRTTLQGTEARLMTRKGFLRRVDCMRWESDQERVNEGGLS